MVACTKCGALYASDCKCWPIIPEIKYPVNMVLKSDYEQIQRERDELAAYCEELTSHLQVASEFITNNSDIPLQLACGVADALEMAVNKSPQACLAERDARVIENLAGSGLFSDSINVKIIQYAKLLKAQQ